MISGSYKGHTRYCISVSSVNWWQWIMGSLVENNDRWRDRCLSLWRQKRKCREEKPPIRLEAIRNFGNRAKVIGPPLLCQRRVQESKLKGIGSGFVGQETSLPSPEQSMTIASAGDTKRVSARTHIVEFCYSYRVEFHHFAKEKSWELYNSRRKEI